MVRVFITMFALILAIASILMQNFPSKPAYLTEIHRRIERQAEDIKSLSEESRQAKRNVAGLKRTQVNVSKSILRKDKKKNEKYRR